MPEQPAPETNNIDTALREVRFLEGAVVRFCGDSGDGMQLAGTQFTDTAALLGNDVATLPDFPAEIRAPRGTLAGVSGFQIHFSSKDIHTAGDKVDALIAMNPAALQTNLPDLRPGGTLIVDCDSYGEKSLEQAGYTGNPLNNGILESYRLFPVGITSLTQAAVAELGLAPKVASRCRNFFSLGLAFWLFGRSLEPTLEFIENKFKARPAVAEANRLAVLAGWNYGETTEAFAHSYRVPRAELPPGRYRNITGNQALAWGLIAAAHLSDKDLFYGSYPITPASEILEELCRRKDFGVKTFQAEDEISAMTAAVGAAFGGAVAATASSGPGLSLKSEALSLAVMLELPLIVIDVQRGGPSTGLPTKPEQTDLRQAVYGRHGECPIPVLAARSPADCFCTVVEAWRLAVRHMTPVIVMSDAHIAAGSEPWLCPDVDLLPPIPVIHPTCDTAERPFAPYRRDEALARPWVLPGEPELMHCLGGLEKEHLTGDVSYEPGNHEQMIRMRSRKIENIAVDHDALRIDGPTGGELLVIGWGATFGPCAEAVRKVREEGHTVSHVHMRHLYPLPADLGDIISHFDKILVPEMNLGHLRDMIQVNCRREIIPLAKVTGRPFTVGEIYERIVELLT